MMKTVARSYAFGPFVLNLQRMALQRDGVDLGLRPKAFDVLRHLVERAGTLMTKDELIAASWPNVIVSDDALTQCVRDIRKVIGGDYIRTVARRGYLFAGDVSTLDPIKSRRERRSTGVAAPFMVALLVAFAIVLGAGALRSREPAAPTSPSVAVLPFDDMGGDPELAYFGRGVSEDIITMLARVPNLTVVARNSSFQFEGQLVDIRRIGENLGATHVLQGSVRKESDRLRIVAQLTDARTGKNVWAERFDRTGGDARALQDEITQKIVAALAGTAGTIALLQYRDAWGKDSANLQEYDYAQRVLARIAQGTPEALELTDAMLREGLARYPNSSLLKAQAAGSIIWRFARGWSDSDDPWNEIRKAGELAREARADPTASPMMRMNVHIVMAYVNMVEQRFDQAVAEAQAAIALAPYDGRLIYYLAEIPVVAGRPSLALAWIERARALYPPDDPRQQELSSMEAYALLHAEGPIAALEVLDGIRSSDDVVLRTTYLLRTYALVLLGRLDEAKAEIRKLRDHDPTWSLATHRKRFFYTDTSGPDSQIEALAAAGLP